MNAVVPAPTIDLSGEAGFEGQLIAPIQLMINGENRVFYFWDRDASGTADNQDGYTHADLDTLFNGGADTTDALDDRSYTMADGTVLRLPTMGMAAGTDVDDNDVVSSGTENQTVYDGLAAIKDAYDGTGTGGGVPPDWVDSFYWSATSTGTANQHVRTTLNSGIWDTEGDGSGGYVALEVITA